VDYESWGSDQTYPHMAVPWAWAFDTPFKWVKQIASHFGGTRQGMAISWPGHINDVGGTRTQFHHVIDIVPTVLEAAGIKAPEVVDGIKQKPIEGVSMAYTFDKANTNAASKRTTQYFEMFANRGIYHDGWYAATTPPSPRGWSARSQCRGSSSTSGNSTTSPRTSRRTTTWQQRIPRSSMSCRQCSLPRRTSTRSFPSTTRCSRALSRRGPAGRTEFVYVGENVGIPVGNAPSILNRNYTITAEITIPAAGAEGMIATMGGRFGGYGLYLRGGKPIFIYNLLNLKRYRWEGGVGAEDWLGKSLEPGKHTIVFDFKYDGPGPGKGGTGVLSVDGKVLARQQMEHSIPFLMSLDESFDIGMDTRTPVDESYELPFRFTGTIDKLTFKIGPEQLAAEDRERMKRALATAHD
jgi:Sulfatase